MLGKSDLLFLVLSESQVFCLVMFWHLCGVTVFGCHFDACLQSCGVILFFCLFVLVNWLSAQGLWG